MVIVLTCFFKNFFYYVRKQQQQLNSHISFKTTLFQRSGVGIEKKCNTALCLKIEMGLPIE